MGDIKIAILSDLHLMEANRKEALENLERTLDRLKRHEPDLLIVLGDMIGGKVTTSKQVDEEDEGIEELKEIRNRVEKLDLEKLYLLGNHEQDIAKDKFEQEFGQSTFGIKEVEGENFVYLDSSAPELSGSRGQISREQLDFLDEKLQELDDAYLIIHHPVHFRDLSHSYYWDIYPERAICGNKKEINNVIQKHDNIRAVFNSHIHDLNLEEFKGRKHFTNPPMISESREKGFNNYYTIAQIGEEVDLTVYTDQEVKNFNFLPEIS